MCVCSYGGNRGHLMKLICGIWALGPPREEPFRVSSFTPHCPLCSGTADQT